VSGKSKIAPADCFSGMFLPKRIFLLAFLIIGYTFSMSLARLPALEFLKQKKENEK